MPATTRVAIYCRLSLDRTGEGLAVERQEAECRKLCDHNGWEVAHVIVDNSISATDTRKPRPGFEQLLTLDDIDAAVVWHVDRLARTPRDLERVIDRKLDVHAVQSSHLDLSNPSGRAVARTLVAWAQAEVEVKSSRQKAAREQHAAKGRPMWVHRPFGLELDGTLRHDEADLIRAGADALLNGATLAAVARDWNRAGVVTPKGNEWVSQTIRQLMLTPRIAGLSVYKGEVVGKGEWAPVIGEDTFHRLRRVLTAPERSSGGPGRPPSTLLSSIASCGLCGAPMATVRHRSNRAGDRNSTVRSYRCRKCGRCMTRQAWADGVTVRFMWEFLPLMREVWPDEQRAAETELAAMEAEIRALEDKLTGLAEDYADGLLTRGQMRVGTDRTRKRLDVKQRELARLHVPSDSWDWLPVDEEAFFKEFDAMPLHEQRRLVEAFFDSIVMHHRGRTRWIPGILEVTPKGFSSVAEARQALEDRCPEVVAQRRADEDEHARWFPEAAGLARVPVDAETNRVVWPKGETAWMDGED